MNNKVPRNLEQRFTPFFEAAAKASLPKSKNKRPAPISLRLTEDERSQLERAAAGMSLSAYVRSRLFGDGQAPHKTRGKFPVKDHQALARVLSALGRTDLTHSIKALQRASERGSLRLSTRSEADLHRACAHIETIRHDLIRALGLKPE